MNNIWGFSISEARVIDYARNDHRPADLLYAEVPDSRLCIGCGGCTATCTAGAMTDFNIRRLQMLVKRGENKEAREQLHRCMLCGKCLLVCPRGVDTRRMILALYRFTNQPSL